MHADLNVSNQFISKIVKLHQKILSEDSIEFMISLAANNYELASIIKDYIKYDAIKRLILPTFLSGFVILTSILNNNEKLILLGRNNKEEFKLLFKPNMNKTEFEICEDLQDKAYFIIEGEIPDSINTKNDFIKYLQSCGIMNILLLNFAIHSQYSCKSLKEYNTENIFMNESLMSHAGIKTLNLINNIFQKKLIMKEKFEREGLFFYCIKHIYSDTVKTNM